MREEASCIIIHGYAAAFGVEKRCGGRFAKVV